MYYLRFPLFYAVITIKMINTASISNILQLNIKHGTIFALLLLDSLLNSLLNSFI